MDYAVTISGLKCYYGRLVTIKLLITRITIFLLLGWLAEASAYAQVLPRAGTHFTFGIPEGADAIADPNFNQDTSLLMITVMSAYDGKGIITSPNGFCKEFSFIAHEVSIVPLPYFLMHLK